MKTIGLVVGVLVILTGVAVAQDAAPADKVLASFEDNNPFTTGELIREFPTDRVWPIVQGEVVADHPTAGGKVLKVSDGALILQGPMDWRGYDFLKIDVFNSDAVPRRFGIEAQDRNSTGFWQQVLYTTILEPGANTVALPLDHIRHGGKGRPKMPVDLAAIKVLALKVYNTPEKPAYLDNLRLEKDTRASKLLFDGLYALDLGTTESPVMSGFKPLDPTMEYTKERGYGLKDAKIYGPAATKGAMDGFHPDPLYRDWLNMEKGSILIDLPNGKYRVFVNLDSPSGYWGEYQFYRRRAVKAQGKVVVDETMDFAALRDRYFRHFADEDLPGDDAFDKYVTPNFREKTFDVDVTDGQLNLEFDGLRMACAVSAVVVYPVDKADQGQAFLDGMRSLRQWHFNNDCKRVLHVGTAADSIVNAEGLLIFNRDVMADVYYNDKPDFRPADAKVVPDRVCDKLAATGLPAQSLPLEFSVVPLNDLGKVTVTAGDLAGPDGRTIPAAAFEIGYVSYRVTRQGADGTIYTIAPRLIVPSNAVNCPAEITRRFWLRLMVPKDAAPGQYKGAVTVVGAVTVQIPVELTVLRGTLDPTDIPVGPFGHTINIPWFADDPAAGAWNEKMVLASFGKMIDAGFTACTGFPVVSYKGFDENRKPILDFSVGDRQMELAKEAGFTMPFPTYCTFAGLNLYTRDLDAMKKAGFTDYSEFIKAIFTEVQKHAEEKQWLGRYWNLGDEPAGKQDLEAALANMEAYRKAFPQGPPYFSFCGSYTEASTDDPHFLFSKAAHVAAWNLHTETSVNNLRAAGGQWAFYNGGDRWTFGTYMYKAAKQFDMKFRPCWHWNIVAGDPYYGLDCREDDFAWCNASPSGELIPSVYFERLREGLTDYRALTTLARLAKAKAGTPEADAARKLIDDRMAAFKLGQRNHDALFGQADYAEFRARLLTAIDALSSVR